MEVPGAGNHKSKHVEKFRRSKGCAVCIKRRIKCDEKRPSCTQCLRGNRQCYGALSSIFCQMNPASLAGSSPQSIPEQPKLPIDSCPELGIKLTWAEPVVGNTGSPPVQQTLPRSLTPEKQPVTPTDLSIETSQGVSSVAIEENDNTATIQQHLSNFVHLYTSVVPRNVLSDTWIDQLPNMLILTKDPLMRMCITAVSLVYCGLVSNSPMLAADSYRWYGAALTRQRRIISELDKNSRKPTIEEICAPIILSFFEVACGNPHTATFNHLHGAARLLERHGPAACSEGILFSLFQTLRILMIYPTVTLRHESVFSFEDWLSIPFLRYPQSHIGRIVDIASLTSNLLSRINSLTTRSAEVRVAETGRIKNTAVTLETQLNCIGAEWWETNQESGSVGDYFNGVKRSYFGHFEACQTSSRASSSSNSTLSDTLPDAASPTPSLDNQPAFQPEHHEDSALKVDCLRCLAFYSAAYLLILSVFQSVDATPAPYKDQIQDHCERILTAASTMNDLHVGYVYLRLVLPLRVIAIFGTPEQKERAEEMIPNCRCRVDKGAFGSTDGGTVGELKR